ncbi:MAG: hypothetical protein LBU34_12760 [Planctomycetaceae bacterium]|jgi:hypothetical protein|nr:hypothetical protein [Planctomycetaceae bacterium]
MCITVGRANRNLRKFVNKRSASGCLPHGYKILERNSDEILQFFNVEDAKQGRGKMRNNNFRVIPRNFSVFRVKKQNTE